MSELTNAEADEALGENAAMMKNGSKESAREYLTLREKEYLVLAALGYINDEIAKILYVSETTVKKTLKNIYAKLGARNRCHTVLIARNKNILDNETIAKIQRKYSLK